MIVTVPLLTVLTALSWQPEWWNPKAYLFFVAAGLAGPCLGRVLNFLSIHHLGVARSVPLKSAAPLLTAILAYWILSERPGPYIWIGTVLIVIGCAMFTYKKKDDSSWNRLLIWLPFAAMTSFSIGRIVRKIGLEMLPSPLIGITVTSITGMIFLIGLSMFMPSNQRPKLEWGKAWVFYGVCGLINMLAFTASFYAIMYGDLTVVTPLSNTSPFFALLMSHFLLRDLERVTGLVVLGTFFLVAGASLIAWRVI
jgi:drug/metabolite transporter (DMT)-like permease